MKLVWLWHWNERNTCLTECDLHAGYPSPRLPSTPLVWLPRIGWTIKLHMTTIDSSCRRLILSTFKYNCVFLGEGLNPRGEKGEREGGRKPLLHSLPLVRNSDYSTEYFILFICFQKWCKYALRLLMTNGWARRYIAFRRLSGRHLGRYRPLAIDIPWSVSDPVVVPDVAASSRLCSNANTETEMPVTHRDVSLSPVRWASDDGISSSTDERDEMLVTDSYFTLSRQMTGAEIDALLDNVVDSNLTAHGYLGIPPMAYRPDLITHEWSTTSTTC